MAAARSTSSAGPDSHRAESQHPQSTEQTPLLARNDDEEDQYLSSQSQRHSSAVSSLLQSLSGRSRAGKRSAWRGPSMIALLVLCLLVVAILVGGFFGPEAIEQYAQQAVVFEPRSLSIDSFVPTGVRARIQGDFMLDASRVEKQDVRNFGRFATWIARGVETRPTDVEVTLPEFGNLVLGTAHVPALQVGLVNGQITQVDFIAELEPGPVEGIRRIANDWIDGRLGQLRIYAHADVGLKSGLISFGVQTISHTITFEGNDVPAIPSYEIRKINVHEVTAGPAPKGLEAEVAVSIANQYPVDLVVPPLGFSILAAGCAPGDPFIPLAEASTAEIHVVPKHATSVNATGIARGLPGEFISDCPHSNKSPMDLLLGDYLSGRNAKIYVRGGDSPLQDTPKWVADLLSSVTVPIDFPSRGMDNLIKNFSLTDVHFGLPNLFAEPGSPESKPTITANIQALIGLPEEINFSVDVQRVRANATIFYKGGQLGILDLHKWQGASSKLVTMPHAKHPDLQVESHVEKAPVTITDEDRFQDVVQALLWGRGEVLMMVHTSVDVDVQTAIGGFVVKDIPAEGVVPIRAPGSGNLTSVQPKIGRIEIVNSTAQSISLSSSVNVNNPTPYSATIPFADIHILCNGTILGHAYVQNLVMKPGLNADIQAEAVWEPSAFNESHGAAVGRELLSRFISGYHSNITLQTHEGSIPGQPGLGKALASFPVDISTSHLLPPSEPDDGSDPDDPDNDDRGPRFIQETTMHLFSSTATFSLKSPFSRSTMYITHLDATAYHEGEPAGSILYEEEIKVEPGITETPKLPVEWSLDSIGFGAIRQALGGTLRLSAEAKTGVRMGEYQTELWFKGKSIGAKVRL